MQACKRLNPSSALLLHEVSAKEQRYPNKQVIHQPWPGTRTWWLAPGSFILQDFHEFLLVYSFTARALLSHSTVHQFTTEVLGWEKVFIQIFYAECNLPSRCRIHHVELLVEVLEYFFVLCIIPDLDASVSQKWTFMSANIEVDMFGCRSISAKRMGQSNVNPLWATNSKANTI